MTKWTYLAVPFEGKITSGLSAAKKPSLVSDQLTAIINEHAAQGWEFHQLGHVTVEMSPGCIPSLFGARTLYVPVDQVVFRRAG